MHTHIIIPTCGCDAVMNCIGGIAEYTPEPYTVYMVINTDDAKKRVWAEMAFGSLAKRSPRHRAVVCHEKIGYVRAVNAAVRLADVGGRDFVAVLNDDVVIEGDWLTPAIEVLSNSTRVGQVGPSVKRVGKNGYWGKPSDRYVFAEGWCFVLGPEVRVGWSAFWCGANANECGIFDDRFSPGYCEDMDLSIRLQEKGGLKIVQVNMPIRHLHSQTFGTGAAREPGWTNNRKYLIQKHHLDSI